jgi:glycosyltransferase involved in cell wall biosynthesis
VNEAESSFWQKVGNVTYLPFAVRQELLNYDRTSQQYAKSIVFFGKMDYQPNIDAVQWFIKKVHPLMNPSIRFIVLGAKPTGEILQLAEKYENIVVTGHMEDPFEVLHSCLLTVAPMQTGAGLQTKVLEAMALGKIVLATSLAANSIKEANNFEHLLLADTAEEMAQIINEIYMNGEKYQEIGNNAKQLVQKYYTLGRYEDAILSILRS